MRASISSDNDTSTAKIVESTTKGNSKKKEKRNKWRIGKNRLTYDERVLTLNHCDGISVRMESSDRSSE